MVDTQIKNYWILTNNVFLDLGRKRSIASSEPDEIESKKIKPTDIEDKKVPADEVSTSFKIEKLERTVRTMTRQVQK